MCLHEFVKLVTRETTLLDNNHSEPKALVRLFRFPEQNYNFLKRRIIKNILPHTDARMRANASRKDNCRPQSGRVQKYFARILVEFYARFYHLQE